jgi:AAA+ ATPase superfamily predicted ATPase
MRGTKQNFVARQYELSGLNRLYTSKKFEMAVIYGRRRVGKTALITEFIKDKSAIYFQAMETSPENNLLFLSERIEEVKFNSEDVKTSGFDKFQTALKEIDNMAKRSKEKLIFIIDEFPYLAKSESGISSMLQEAIDHIYKNNSNLMLILCGSSMSFMEKQVLGAKSPLYGRRTAQFKLLPFTIFETNELLPNVPKEDLLAYHGITGGIPQYLEYVDEVMSLEENIQQMFLTMDAPLLAEPSNLLQQELRNPATYNSIISAIANGKSKYSEITSVSGVASGSVMTYLDNLIDLGIIEKKSAIFDKRKGKSIYKIKDGLFRFWFRFIDGKMERIARHRTSSLLSRIMDELPQYLGFTFEEACVDWMWQQEILDFEPAEVRNWWGNDPEKNEEVEVDIVAPDDSLINGVVAECKWKNKENMKVKMLDILEHRAALVPKIRNKQLLFFAKEVNSEFRKEAEIRQIQIILFENFFEESK